MQRYLPYVTVLIGIILVALGIWLLAGREITVAGRPLAHGAAMGADGATGLDVRLRHQLRGCVAIVHGRAVSRGDRRRTSWPPSGAVAVYVAYAAGFTLVVGVLAMAAALANSATVDRVRRIVPYVNRISGALLLSSASTSAITGSTKSGCSRVTAILKTG